MQKNLSEPSSERVLLVIDDEEEVTKFLKRVFRKQYNVRSATSAEEGLDIMDEVAVHVVISDQRMPGMKGTEFFKEVKDRHPKVVRIILTGYSDLDAVVDAINEGRVYRYITKPWEPDQLNAIVKDSFDRYWLHVENDRLMKELDQANEMLEMRVVERTEAMESAEAASKAKSLFIANMSHELRTPLNGIIVSADLALGQELPPKTEKILKTISRSGHAILRTVNTILDFSESESDELKLATIPFRLDEVLGKLSGAFIQKGAQKQIKISFDIAGDKVPNALIGDPDRLVDVFNHLLDNAAKFSTGIPKAVIGVRDVGTSAKKAKLEFYVKDNGIGIASEDFEKIFDAFTQVDDSHTRQYDGTGMGLAVSKRLVEEMGGTIRVESDLGKGSTFYFTASFERQDQEHPFKVLSTEGREDTTVKQKSSEIERKMGRPEQLLELLSTMEPFIQKRNPKQCKEIMAEISACGWPDEYAQDITELCQWIEKYKFKDALFICESTMKNLKS